MRKAVAIMAFGVVVASAAAWRQARDNERVANEQLQSQSQRLAAALVQRIQQYEYGLRGARGVVTAAGEQRLSRGLFRTYMESRDIDREFPGARGFGFIERVQPEQEVAYVAAARRDGWPQFNVKQLNAHDGERYVIRYIEPVQRNLQAVGLDIASEHNRRAAAQVAARDGLPALTGPITLVQATGAPQRSFLFVLPVYRANWPLATPEQRQAATRGWTYAPLLIDEVLKDVDTTYGELAFDLYDVTDEQDKQLFYTRGDESQRSDGASATVMTQTYGRTWRMEIRPLPAFYAGLNLLSPTWAFFITIIIAALVASMIFAYASLQLRKRELQQFNVRLEQQVTERTAQLESALRENDALLKTLHKHALVSITDKAGTIVDVNDSFCALSGYSREELLGRSHRIVNSGAHSEEFWEHMWTIIVSGRDWTGEICNRAKDGSLYWVDSVIAPLTVEDGSIKRYISIRTDVTARKADARALTQERERLQNILRGTNAGTWELNLQTGEARYNERWAQIVGYTLDDLAPLRIDTGVRFLHPEDAAAVRELFRRHIKRELDEFEFESRIQHRDGTQRWVLDRGRVMTWTPDGKAEWMFGTRQDITARHEMEQSLRDATQKAQAASAAKSQFLANMSHEIRTPLNAIIGMCYLLEGTTLSAEQRNSFAKIQVAGRSLLGIINNVLDLSKIEAGEMDLEQAPFDLHQLLQEVEQLLVSQTQRKGIKLLIPARPHGVPRVLLGDVTRVRQILINLLGNAAKFTEQGQIELRIDALAISGADTRLRLAVRDTGIGIAPEAMAKLFTPFSQADASTTRRFGGTGLGLSIVQQLAKLMGGAIGASSEVDVGSEFWVELPFKIADQSSLREDITLLQSQSLGEVRVLVVDDSDVNLEVARTILERHGMAVSVRSDGQQALELLRARPGDFDVVLMDVQMPVMDGNVATRHIRGKLGLTQLPIIALTAGALVTERQRTLDAGMDDFLSKPIDPSALIKIVRRYAQRARKEGAPTQVEPVQVAEMATWPEVEGIDGAAVADVMGYNVDLFVKLLGRLIDEYAEFTALAVRDLSDPDNRRALAARMHKLKGSAGMMGARAIQRLAGEAEAALKSDASELHIATLMEELASALRSLTQQVRALQRSYAPPHDPPAANLAAAAT